MQHTRRLPVHGHSHHPFKLDGGLRRTFLQRQHKRPPRREKMLVVTSDERWKQSTMGRTSPPLEWRPCQTGQQHWQTQGGRGSRALPPAVVAQPLRTAWRLLQRERDAVTLLPGEPSGSLSTGVPTPARTSPAAARNTTQRNRPGCPPTGKRANTAGCQSPQRDKHRHPPAHDHLGNMGAMYFMSPFIQNVQNGHVYRDRE